MVFPGNEAPPARSTFPSPDAWQGGLDYGHRLASGSPGGSCLSPAVSRTQRDGLSSLNEA